MSGALHHGVVISFDDLISALGREGEESSASNDSDNTGIKMSGDHVPGNGCECIEKGETTFSKGPNVLKQRIWFGGRW